MKKAYYKMMNELRRIQEFFYKYGSKLKGKHNKILKH